MTFTGTLIEDLMTTVERAELRAQPDGAPVLESLMDEPSASGTWFASVEESLEESTEYDSRFVGVA